MEEALAADEKRCARCAGVKVATREFFGPLKTARDGLHSWCKACLAQWRREDRSRRPEHYSQIERRRHLREGETRRQRNRDWYAARPPQVQEAQRERAKQKATLYNGNRRERFAANPERRAQRAAENKRWRKNNADAASARRKAKWRAATPAQKLRSYFGAAISHALKGSGKGGRSWQQLVGYRAGELKAHIERQFVRGMTWDNYGDWHIDHILPATSFQYSSPEDDAFQACWALTNLRPLWAGDNIRKRDQRLHLI